MFRPRYAQQELEWSSQLIECQMVATMPVQSRPLRPALKGAPKDDEHYFEIGAPFIMIEIMNLIEVVLGKRSLLRSTGRFSVSNDECATAMMKISPGEVTGWGYTAD